MGVFYIGVNYLFAGIGDNKHFTAVSVFVRLVCFELLFFGYLALFGHYIDLRMGLYFGIAEATLSIITYFLYKRYMVDARQLDHLVCVAECLSCCVSSVHDLL